MISYIIPFYNGGKYIEYALRSIMDQSWENMEIIVVDDGSRIDEHEKLETIINTIADNRIRTIRCETNQGLMSALRIGLKQAKYEIVSILGQDDMVGINHAEVMSSILENNNELAFCFCDSYIIYNNEISNKLLRGEKLPTTIGKSIYKDFLQLWRWNFVSSAGICINKKYLIDAGGFKTGYRNYGEWLIWLRLASKYGIAFSGDVINFYRKHEGNITNQLFTKDYLRTFWYFIRVIREGWSLSHKHTRELMIMMQLYIKQIIILFFKTIFPIRLSHLLRSIKK